MSRASVDSPPKWHKTSKAWRKRITIDGKQKTYTFKYPKTLSGYELAVEDWLYTLALIQNKEPDAQSGVSLYLIKCGNSYKIGISRNVSGRLETLQTSNPTPLELVATCRAANALYVERWLHERFASKRIRGEWFALNKEDVDALLLLFGEQ